MCVKSFYRRVRCVLFTALLFITLPINSAFAEKAEKLVDEDVSSSKLISNYYSGLRLNKNVKHVAVNVFPGKNPSECRVLENSDTEDYFVPAGSLDEWHSFLLNKPAKISVSDCRGICGSANGKLLAYGAKFTPNPSELCLVGIVSAVSGSGPWKWTCQGIDGAASASCVVNMECGKIPAKTSSGACPSGYSGSATYTQTYSCPSGVEPGSWSSPYQTENNCSYDDYEPSGNSGNGSSHSSSSSGAEPSCANGCVISGYGSQGHYTVTLPPGSTRQDMFTATNAMNNRIEAASQKSQAGKTPYSTVTTTRTGYYDSSSGKIYTGVSVPAGKTISSSAKSTSTSYQYSSGNGSVSGSSASSSKTSATSGSKTSSTSSSKSSSSSSSSKSSSSSSKSSSSSSSSRSSSGRSR